MMRVIRAQDAIQQINLMAAAYGSMEDTAASEFSRQLQLQATLTGAPSERAIRPKSFEELAALMGGSRQEIVVE